MNEIVNIISSVGFPIVCAIVLFKLYIDTITGFKKSIDNNTKMTQKVYDLIETIVDKFNLKKG